MISKESTFLILNAAIVIAAYFWFRRLKRLKSADAESTHGISREWQLSDEKSTEIISNKRIGHLQRAESCESVKANDKIIVWAREFLDDDILYEQVKYNIECGISYFYIIGYDNRDRFINLIRKLEGDFTAGQKYRNLVDVIFVTREMTLNNIVVLYSREASKRRCYSSLIYGDRPFAWVAQHESKIAEMEASVKTLLHDLSRYQSKNLSTCATVPRPDEQLMQYAGIWEDLNNGPGFDLHAVLEKVDLPTNVAAVAGKLPQGDPKSE